MKLFFHLLLGLFCWYSSPQLAAQVSRPAYCDELPLTYNKTASNRTRSQNSTPFLHRNIKYRLPFYASPIRRNTLFIPNSSPGSVPAKRFGSSNPAKVLSTAPTPSACAPNCVTSVTPAPTSSSSSATG